MTIDELREIIAKQPGDMEIHMDRTEGEFILDDAGSAEICMVSSDHNGHAVLSESGNVPRFIISRLAGLHLPRLSCTQFSRDRISLVSPCNCLSKKELRPIEQTIIL